MSNPNTIGKFIDFLRGKFTGLDGNGLSWGDTHGLLFEGAPDTEGSYHTGVDYNALLAKIDEFAAEFDRAIKRQRATLTQTTTPDK